MYLKSLTLRGFKSFASATTLNFEPGITCVVGPNGSGKSNVVDALTWVMGEQGAKSLRGGKMEDVIFAGTPSRPPLGRAEVVLTIDNTDGALPIDYAEVTIARTMFRNGGSDYAINNRPARLLDVQELLSDSGIGREMHVIVGQGQLDSILQATPELRRGFIEEAAGVLKHRKRKEKALRKLEACEGNLTRLADLITEIRRQLKPLGRQAEVARKAAIIQAELRDARARLLADDLVQATLAGVAGAADEEATLARRRTLELALESARAAEAAAENAVRESLPRLRAAQESWYGLAALRERVATTMSIARERRRNAANAPAESRAGRDPEELDREAAEVVRQEQALSRQIAERADALRAATADRSAAEAAYSAADTRLAALVRAVADRREGLARLGGQVASARSRAEAAEAEIGRLREAIRHATERADQANRAFTALESTVAGLDAGELDLDTDHETAVDELGALAARLAELRRDDAAAVQERTALAARVEALKLGLARKDATNALLDPGVALTGVLGAVARLVRVEPSYERAIAAALGAASDAVVVAGVDAAVEAFDHLKAADLGRAALVVSHPGRAAALADSAPADSALADPALADPAVTDLASAGPALLSRAPTLGLPPGARRATDVVDCPDDLRAAVEVLLDRVVIVADLAVARELLRSSPDLRTVTLDGDVLSGHFAAGGSSAQPSTLEMQAAVDETEARLAAATHEAERLRFAQVELAARHAAARAVVEATLARLHESDAALAAVAEELGQLSSQGRSAAAEADHLRTALAAAEQAHAQHLTSLADLEQRLAAATATAETAQEPDPAERDRLGLVADTTRAAEMEARLALRTMEERVRGLAGRADNMRRAAAQERRARAAAAARRARIRREARTAVAVLAAGSVLADRVERSLALAAGARDQAESARAAAEAQLTTARAAVRTHAAEVERLVDAAHRSELARAEHRMRIAALTERALSELGLSAEVLLAEYGPDQLVPVLSHPDGSPITAEDKAPPPVPYARDRQEKRLRTAERDLAVLGRVNPLALEEFQSMEERHAFLAEQLEDLRRTRRDLHDIIADVDARVEQVFAEAYADVERAFVRVFARLFPGGEGRLVLTDPGHWLTTGVDVEARPPGKKIKRLSLLSGGERSLVAVAFLVSLFIARPSPFYILDEVEAALDDTNLGRLLEIYEELRTTSQLLVITHQKRTMEIADALYGVTMRGDGVSAVISQRLRERESVA